MRLTNGRCSSRSEYATLAATFEHASMVLLLWAGKRYRLFVKVLSRAAACSTPQKEQSETDRRPAIEFLSPSTTVCISPAIWLGVESVVFCTVGLGTLFHGDDGIFQVSDTRRHGTYLYSAFSPTGVTFAVTGERSN